MRLLPTALLTLAGIGVAAPARAGNYAPKVGERHPDFTLANIETGKPVSLSDYRGKKVLLMVYASW
jgi:hypothetical protein